MFRSGEKMQSDENETLPTTRDSAKPSCWKTSRCYTDSKFRNRISCLVFLIILLIASILIAISVKKVDENEYAISYAKYSKKLAEAAKSGGLFTGPPGFEFIRFPSLYITEDLDPSICVSRDGLRVAYEVTFQYQMPEPWLLPAILKYRDFEGWARIVAAAGDSAVQFTCSQFEVSK